MAFYKGKEKSPLDDDDPSAGFKFNINPDGSDPRKAPAAPVSVDLLARAQSGEGLIEVGRHCADPECKQLDFLPHHCYKCDKYYCLDHFGLTHHACVEDISTVNSMPRCPVCAQFVRVPRDGSKDEFVDRHIQSGCKEHLLALSDEQRRALRQAWHCDAGSCANRDKLSVIQCPKCFGNYCLSHRFPDDHHCDQAASAHAQRARDARAALVANRKAGAAAAAAANAGAGAGAEDSKGGLFGTIKSASQALLEKLRIKREARQSEIQAKQQQQQHRNASASASVAHGPAPPTSATNAPAAAATTASAAPPVYSVPNLSRPILSAPGQSLAASASRTPPHLLSPASGRSPAMSPAISPSPSPGLPPALSPAATATATATSMAAPAEPVSYLPAPEGRFGARATGSALQKLQQEAVGDSAIPIASRVCLVIRFPSAAALPTAATAPAAVTGTVRLPPALVRAGLRAVVWADKRWTVGRLLDEVCKRTGVVNNNHLAGRPKAHLAPSAAPGSAFGFGDKLESLEAARDGAALAFGWTVGGP